MSQKENFSEEKKRRIAVGATVGGVLLIVFLLTILIIQFVQIGVGNARKNRLDREIQEYERLIQEGEENLEWYKSGNGLYLTARKYGWR